MMDTVIGWITNWDRMPMSFVLAFLALFLFDKLFCSGLYDVVKAKKPATGAEKEKNTDSAAADQQRPKKPKPQKSRWFALHVFGNLIVCIAAIRPFVQTILDPAHAGDAMRYPDTSMFGTATQFPLIVIITLHFYHMAIFDDLSSADYFHHLMFIPTMGIPGLMYNWGPAQSFLCVFISGLPGGIEYFFLALSKMGLLDDRSFLKKLAALQNTWCRWPGILIGCYHIYMGMIYGTLQVPWVFAVLVGGLSSFNAIYYGFQAISAHTKDTIIQQWGRDGPKMFDNSGRNIRVNRPGS